MQNYISRSFLNSLNTNNSTDALKVMADIIGEFDAIIQYEQHIMSTTNQTMKNTLTDIKMEEQVHVGQLLGLLFYLDPSFEKQVMQGLKEFKESTKPQENQ